MDHDNCICFLLLRQLIPTAVCLALLKAGSSMAANMAMMAMTTSSSISVNALGPDVSFNFI